jgi:hypothetical protein|tara:strand:+ start:491 stop:739 length:249 start_codon:yes stop_codon:yes gene_type:complete
MNQPLADNIAGNEAEKENQGDRYDEAQTGNSLTQYRLYQGLQEVVNINKDPVYYAHRDRERGNSYQSDTEFGSQPPTQPRYE